MGFSARRDAIILVNGFSLVIVLDSGSKPNQSTSFLATFPLTCVSLNLFAAPTLSAPKAGTSASLITELTPSAIFGSTFITSTNASVNALSAPAADIFATDAPRTPLKKAEAETLSADSPKVLVNC